MTVVLTGLVGLGCSTGTIPIRTAPATPWHRLETPLPVVQGRTPEERAERVLGTLNQYCGRPGPCVAEYESVAPPLQMPSNERYYVDNFDDEVRTLGFTYRWDPGTDRAAIVAGNTPQIPTAIEWDP